MEWTLAKCPCVIHDYVYTSSVSGKSFSKRAKCCYLALQTYPNRGSGTISDGLQHSGSAILLASRGQVARCVSEHVVDALYSMMGSYIPALQWLSCEWVSGKPWTHVYRACQHDQAAPGEPAPFNTSNTNNPVTIGPARNS